MTLKRVGIRRRGRLGTTRRLSFGFALVFGAFRGSVPSAIDFISRGGVIRGSGLIVTGRIVVHLTRLLMKGKVFRWSFIGEFLLTNGARVGS